MYFDNLKVIKTITDRLYYTYFFQSVNTAIFSLFYCIKLIFLFGSDSLYDVYNNY